MADGLLIDTHYRTYIVEPLQVVADDLNVVHIMYAEANGAVEDSVVGLDEDALHVYVELLGDDIGNLIYHSHTINTLDVDGYGEVEQLVSTPLGCHNAVAIGSLELGSFRTFTLVDDNLSVAIDEAQHIVAWDGMAAVGHVVATLQGLVGKDEWTLLVNLLGGIARQWRVLADWLLLLAAAEEATKDIRR